MHAVFTTELDTWRVPCLLPVPRYYINLCQGIHGGLPGCPEGATVCRHSAAGTTQTLGRVHTQRMSYTGERPHLLILYCTWGPKHKNICILQFITEVSDQ